MHCRQKPHSLCLQFLGLLGFCFVLRVFSRQKDLPGFFFLLAALLAGRVVMVQMPIGPGCHHDCMLSSQHRPLHAMLRLHWHSRAAASLMVIGAPCFGC